jgi:hypothetical protein
MGCKKLHFVWIALDYGCLLRAQRTSRHPYVLLDDNAEFPGKRSKLSFGL